MADDKVINPKDISVEDVYEAELDPSTSLDISSTEASGINLEPQQQQDGESGSSSTKYILISIAIVVIVFASLFIFRPEYLEPVTTAALVKTTHTQPSAETARKYTYNNIEFNKINDFWHASLITKNTVYNVQFYYGPRELEQIPSKGWFGPAFQEKEAYVTFDPTDKNFTFIALSVGQLDTHLIKSFKKDIIAACAVNETEVCQSRSIIDCSNANDSAVYYIKESSKPRISFNNNCVLIEGSGWDLVKSTEALIMRMYNIIQR